MRLAALTRDKPLLFVVPRYSHLGTGSAASDLSGLFSSVLFVACGAVLCCPASSLLKHSWCPVPVLYDLARFFLPLRREPWLMRCCPPPRNTALSVWPKHCFRAYPRSTERGPDGADQPPRAGARQRPSIFEPWLAGARHRRRGQRNVTPACPPVVTAGACAQKTHTQGREGVI